MKYQATYAVHGKLLAAGLSSSLGLGAKRVEALLVLYCPTRILSAGRQYVGQCCRQEIVVLSSYRHKQEMGSGVQHVDAATELTPKIVGEPLHSARERSLEKFTVQSPILRQERSRLRQGLSFDTGKDNGKL